MAYAEAALPMARAVTAYPSSITRGANSGFPEHPQRVLWKAPRAKHEGLGQRSDSITSQARDRGECVSESQE